MNLLYTIVLSVITKIVIKVLLLYKNSWEIVFLQIKRKNIVFCQTNRILLNKIQKFCIFYNFPYLLFSN